MSNIFKDSFKVALLLEYYGVRFDNCGEDIDGYYKFRFSVPESSTINSENKELNTLLKTSTGLMAITKKYTKECIMMQHNEDDDYEEFKSFLAEHVKFFAKVRTGEVWTEEMGKARVEELTKQIKAGDGYEEV